MPFNQPRQKSVSQSQFAMVPRNDVPRSRIRQRSGNKTTLDANYLVPVYLNEVLPGDSFRVSMTAFARMQPAIFPLMDNIYMDSFWFFVPARLLWSKWKNFMGEAETGGIATDYTMPIMANATFGGAAPATIPDYFGLPSNDQVTGTLTDINALPFRAYKLIWDEWFRDENLQVRLMDAATDFGDGPDTWAGVQTPQKRNKRRDYFTSCLPWPQKGTAATIPIDGLAPIQGMGWTTQFAGSPINTGTNVVETARGGLAGVNYPNFYVIEKTPAAAGDAQFVVEAQSATGDPQPAMYADLSQATNATIEALRYANMLQIFMERDARGGTRYTEILRSHFGVVSPDARLQRPEYLGGASTPVSINPVAQTSETGAGTPLGQLAGVGTGVHQSGFSQSFTEHGYLMCILNVRADLTYQQGYHKLWTRRTKLDFYWPAFAHLGEQAVLRREIYAVGDPAFDDLVFGYQERWGEYRYHPSKITGMFRSGITGTLDAWHLAQEFSAPPVLNSAFIEENVPMSRILAAGALTDNQQFLFDSVFDATLVRPIPMFSVPGLGGRF